jgi:hypothetical protein
VGDFTIPYGILQYDEGSDIYSKGLTREDLINKITKYAIIDPKVKVHQKKIIFLFVKLNKQKAPSVTFVVTGSSRNPRY